MSGAQSVTDAQSLGIGALLRARRKNSFQDGVRLLLVFWRGTRAKHLITRRLPAGCDQRCFLLRSKRHVGRSLIDKPRHLLAVTCTGGTILGFLLEEDFATHDLVHPFTAISAGDAAPV